jgi:hypothetical protein
MCHSVGDSCNLIIIVWESLFDHYLWNSKRWEQIFWWFSIMLRQWVLVSTSSRVVSRRTCSVPRFLNSQNAISYRKSSYFPQHSYGTNAVKDINRMVNCTFDNGMWVKLLRSYRVRVIIIRTDFYLSEKVPFDDVYMNETTSFRLLLQFASLYDLCCNACSFHFSVRSNNYQHYYGLWYIYWCSFTNSKLSLALVIRERTNRLCAANWTCYLIMCVEQALMRRCSLNR